MTVNGVVDTVKSIALALLVSLISGCTREQGADNYSALLISIDTLRADHLSCYGYARNTSPHMDEFARGAVRFTDCITPEPLTLPSHTSMFTGLHVATHAVLTNGLHVPDKLVFFSEILRDQGFETCAFIGTDVIGSQFNFDQGFELFQQFSDVDKPVRGGKTADAVVQWLSSRDRHRPFFAFVHFWDVHTPYGTSGEFRNMYCKPDAGKEPLDQHAVFPILRKEWEHFRYYRSDRDLYHMIAKYDEGISYADHQIGRILKALHDVNLDGRVAIIITSDHGEGLGDYKNDFEHGATVFQNTLHVPLIISLPGVHCIAETRSTPVSLIDLAPTILDFLSIENRRPLCDGKSLLPLLKSNEPPGSSDQRVRYARSGARHGKNIHQCILRRSMKFIRAENTEGQSIWMLPLDVPLDGASRLRAFVNSPLAASMWVKLSGGDQFVFVRSEVPVPADYQQPPVAAWAYARATAPDGWVQVVASSLDEAVADGLPNGDIRISSVFFNLGQACSWEGTIDDIQVERDGKWVTVESFETPTRPVLTRLVWDRAKTIESFDVISHSVTGHPVHDGVRAEHLSIEFPEHPFGRLMYNLEADPHEQINIVSAMPEEAETMEHELLSRAKQMEKNRMGPHYDVLDKHALDTLRGLNYLR